MCSVFMLTICPGSSYRFNFFFLIIKESRAADQSNLEDINPEEYNAGTRKCFHPPSPQAPVLEADRLLNNSLSLTKASRHEHKRDVDGGSALLGPGLFLAMSHQYAVVSEQVCRIIWYDFVYHFSFLFRWLLEFVALNIWSLIS
jgi:hypothetical protein